MEQQLFDTLAEAVRAPSLLGDVELPDELPGLWPWLWPLAHPLAALRVLRAVGQDEEEVPEGQREPLPEGDRLHRGAQL